MGAKKKLTQKVKLFYRGPLTNPTKIADDHELKIIKAALKDVVLKRGAAFTTEWRGENISLKLVVGLSASLRCLKHKRSLALIYDDTAPAHLSRYFIEFARKDKIPIIQAHMLQDIAPDINLKTILVATIAEIATGKEEIYLQPSQPKPRSIEKVLVSGPFNELCQLMQSIECDGNEKMTYKPPLVDKITCSETSKVKDSKKKKKKVKNKQTQGA